MPESKSFGLLAEFDSPQTLFVACESVRDAGFRFWDAYTPFPVHGLDQAMGMPRSRLPWIVIAMGLCGLTFGLSLQTWVHTVGYPLVISGKPLFAWQAFIPITFETSILLASFGAVFGMLFLNGLPRLNHPLFSSERFERVTDDGFFICIETRDPQFDERATKKLLKKLGATHIELVEG